jgi:histidine triad (HIT) family protein
MDCIFCQIRDKKSPATILYEDDEVMVFTNIQPVRSVHLLIIPKQHISDFLLVEDGDLLQKLFTIAQKMVKREGLQGKGFRVTVNGGGAQLIHHLHIHLIGPMTTTATLG